MKKFKNFSLKLLLIVVLIYLFNPVSIQAFIEQHSEQKSESKTENIAEIYEKKIIPYELIPEPRVYFCPRDKCDEILAEEIKKYQTADCALHDLNLKNVIEALETRPNVRVVLDDHYQHRVSGDFYRFDTSRQITHNKFCILDNKTIITGSTNPTENCATKNNNNLIIIESQYLVHNYNSEFEELWNGQFGRGSRVEFPRLNLSGNLYENYFCPEDYCQWNVLRLLETAKESIYFMCFSFTDEKISDKIIEKHNLGIEVRGILEKRRITMQYEQFRKFNSSGLNVIPSKNRYFMHHKVFIIDNSTVITGSYNPTGAGNSKNDENILVIHDEKIAQLFLEEFEILWNE